MKKAKLRELLREREQEELEVTEEQVQQIADAIVGVATNEGKPVDELVNEMIDDTPETSSEEVVQAVAEAIVIQADEDGKTIYTAKDSSGKTVMYTQDENGNKQTITTDETGKLYRNGTEIKTLEKPLMAKIAMKAKTVITGAMIATVDEIVKDDHREQTYNMI